MSKIAAVSAEKLTYYLLRDNEVAVSMPVFQGVWHKATASKT
jgi:hypothetical protein